MFAPDDPLAPPRPTFEEPWQAQALALADTLVRARVFSATDWAVALGAELKQAEANGQPDTLTTYFSAVVAALEALSTSATPLTAADLDQRKADWVDAYNRTPHGQPVRLDSSD